MHNFWQDVRFGLRMLRKNPGFTVVAMVTLAFGIGASAAIFSVVDTVLLRSLPFPRPSELVAISAQVKAFDIPYLPLSYPDFVELRSSSSSLSSVAIYASDGKEFSSDDKPQRVENIQVSENFFAVLGMQPLYGRTFVASDMRPGSRAALLGFSALERKIRRRSSSCWKNYYIGRAALHRGRYYVVATFVGLCLRVRRVDSIYTQ